MDARRVFQKDSVVLRDDLPELKSTRYATTEDGRYIFILGNGRVTSIGLNREDDDDVENLSEDEAMTFDIDVVDLFLSKRVRITGCSDLFGFGVRRGFYALNERSFVIIDHHEESQTLRQRLIEVDIDTKKAWCSFYRSYDMQFDSIDSSHRLNIVVGEKLSVIVSRELETAFTFPSDPFSPTQHRYISALLEQADELVEECNAARDSGQGELFIPPLPFISTNWTICFFVDGSPNDVSWFLLTHVILIDLKDEAVYLQELAGSSSSPHSLDTMAIAWLHMYQANDREIFALAIFDELIVYGGIMNTRTFSWTQMPELTGEYRKARPITWRDGKHLFVVDDAESVGDSRVIGELGEGEEEWTKMPRFRLFRHPHKVPSLLRLSMVALQKAGLLNLKQLQLLDERIA